MSEKLIMNDRGTITLPSKMRQHLGLKTGDVLEIEERDGQLILKPTMTLPMVWYTDEDIARWAAADAMTEEDRERWDKSLKKGKKA